ncbi:glycosyltransferase [Arthrobacter sp. H14-L1]|uniref:glycosyltransferase n=1 Tax=Arthrobacter sp. H14-L1 TaxID=2996697 RepID=UPI002271019C|nr:glycosyltransferase [Arthrobacter sp. H14-L1]MCY0905456.1 glycosyltransferase [Arthrobacter sp. H14-L1]
MKVVLAHEWLTNLAGSEKVLLRLAEIFPEAEIVTAVASPEFVGKHLPKHKVTCLLSPKLPGILTHWSRYAPVIWLAWRVKKIDADLIIVSSHFGAHQICHRTPGKTIVYYHTPLRMLWKFDIEKQRIARWAAVLLERCLPILKRLDRAPAAKATMRIANSTETQRRVEVFYACDSLVIHPPVDVRSQFPSTGWPGGDEYYLCLGRLVEYKRVDQAITACNKLGKRLIVAGSGPLEKHLRRLAGPTIEFFGQVDDDEKAELLRGAKALLFPGLEDFGIVPVEAMAQGTPVIGLGVGGLTDTVTPETGILYQEPNSESLELAILEFERSRFDPEVLMQSASRFSAEEFSRKLRSSVVAVMGG